MRANVSAIERAFQLAETGRYLTVTEIKLRLHAEGYHHGQIEGPVLCRQLGEVMFKANAAHHSKPRDKKAPTIARRG